MIIGALVLSVLAFTHEEIGGYEQLVGYQDGDDDDGQVDDEYDHDGRHADDADVPTSYPQVDKFFTATATIRANASLDGLDKCGAVPKDSMHLLRSAKPGESDLPWYVTLCSCIPISPSPGPG